MCSLIHTIINNIYFLIWLKLKKLWRKRPFKFWSLFFIFIRCLINHKKAVTQLLSFLFNSSSTRETRRKRNTSSKGFSIAFRLQRQKSIFSMIPTKILKASTPQLSSSQIKYGPFFMIFVMRSLNKWTFYKLGRKTLTLRANNNEWSVRMDWRCMYTLHVNVSYDNLYHERILICYWYIFVPIWGRFLIKS